MPDCEKFDGSCARSSAREPAEGDALGWSSVATPGISKLREAKSANASVATSGKGYGWRGSSLPAVHLVPALGRQSTASSPDSGANSASTPGEMSESDGKVPGRAEANVRGEKGLSFGGKSR